MLVPESLYACHQYRLEERDSRCSFPGAHLLNFSIADLDFMAHDGVDLGLAVPFLSILPAEAAMTFGYGPKRENWCALFLSPNLRQKEAGRVHQVRIGGEWISVPCAVTLAPARVAVCRSMFREMASAMAQSGPESVLRAAMLFADITRPLFEAVASEAVQSPARRYRDLLEKTAAEDCSLERLCAEVGYQEDHLRELFRREYGLLPGDYRAQIRIRIATRLLTQTDAGVSEVARLSGFRSARYFCTAFRRFAGATPTDYRRAFGKH